MTWTPTRTRTDRLACWLIAAVVVGLWIWLMPIQCSDIEEICRTKITDGEILINNHPRCFQ